MSWNFVQKISAFYIEKNSFFLKKKLTYAVVSKYAKIGPTDGACYPDFQWSFWAKQPKN